MKFNAVQVKKNRKATHTLKGGRGRVEGEGGGGGVELRQWIAANV